MSLYLVHIRRCAQNLLNLVQILRVLRKAHRGHFAASLHPQIPCFGCISRRTIKLHIRSFSSDNCSGFIRFVRSTWPDGLVLALICAAHLNGEYTFLSFDVTLLLIARFYSYSFGSMIRIRGGLLIYSRSIGAEIEEHQSMIRAALTSTASITRCVEFTDKYDQLVG